MLLRHARDFHRGQFQRFIPAHVDEFIRATRRPLPLFQPPPPDRRAFDPHFALDTVQQTIAQRRGLRVDL